MIYKIKKLNAKPFNIQYTSLLHCASLQIRVDVLLLQIHWSVIVESCYMISVFLSYCFVATVAQESLR